ncbi:hypothetical protein PPSIR1_22059 [Plesiocystis pacifica SIR-1]|uniref:Uncharacterized protein n=1 Tax=Plesiocystis pacifica SIR-1 TaxID=391625 RepID=A6FXQ9_9BACT|nr:hypothetical protein [Plesiocystis pacifica]EDM81647.1 hypothetical protein PPSIR1_22059 [Plesiocystis pacifica SIR-1]
MTQAKESADENPEAAQLRDELGRGVTMRARERGGLEPLSRRLPPTSPPPEAKPWSRVVRGRRKRQIGLILPRRTS